MEFNDKYEKQMISIDISIFSIIDNKLNVLLMQRSKEPFANMWSLVGGGVYNNETCEEAVKRELKEKINITNIIPTLSGVFSEPNRDIRFRNISISYYCLTNNTLINNNLEKAISVKWCPICDLPKLAFDHNKILNLALDQLKLRVYDIPFIKPYLPEYFTLKNLQSIYESIIGTSLDKRNFRRKINSMNCLENTGEKNLLDSHRKSDVFKFNSRY